jgi:hypothetical protein
MHIQMTEPDHRKERTKRIRLRMYWISSALATLVFLMFVYVMSVVPGIYPGEKLWMLSVAGVMLAASLGIGVWKFRTSEALFMTSPLGAALSMVLLLELAVCIASVFQVYSKTHR